MPLGLPVADCVVFFDGRRLVVRAFVALQQGLEAAALVTPREALRGVVEIGADESSWIDDLTVSASEDIHRGHGAPGVKLGVRGLNARM